VDGALAGLAGLLPGAGAPLFGFAAGVEAAGFFPCSLFGLSFVIVLPSLIPVR
jgi:hypothetical protein